MLSSKYFGGIVRIVTKLKLSRHSDIPRFHTIRNIYYIYFISKIPSVKTRFITKCSEIFIHVWKYALKKAANLDYKLKSNSLLYKYQQKRCNGSIKIGCDSS